MFLFLWFRASWTLLGPASSASEWFEWYDQRRPKHPQTFPAFYRPFRPFRPFPFQVKRRKQSVTDSIPRVDLRHSAASPQQRVADAMEHFQLLLEETPGKFLWIHQYAGTKLGKRNLQAWQYWIGSLAACRKLLLVTSMTIMAICELSLEQFCSNVSNWNFGAWRRWWTRRARWWGANMKRLNIHTHPVFDQVARRSYLCCHLRVNLNKSEHH